MFLYSNTNRKLWNMIPKKYFKVKMKLDQNNIKIFKNPIYTKVDILKGGEINLNNKTFIFDNETSFDKIISNIESEYDTSFVIDADLQKTLSENINYNKSESEDKELINKNLNFIQEILDISNKLNLEEKEIANFLGKVLEKNQSDVKKINNLKIIHFSIVQELERLEKIKNRADKTASFRVTIILLILLSILIVQTGGFYHMIYNIDYLGWDLVEPATFLFSSALFLLGVFSYAKLHKNAISGEKLFSDLTKSIMTKRYIKTNFNQGRYDDLKNQLELVNNLMKESKRI